jgi:hypothetical protein
VTVVCMHITSPHLPYEPICEDFVGSRICCIFGLSPWRMESACFGLTWTGVVSSEILSFCVLDFRWLPSLSSRPRQTGMMSGEVDEGWCGGCLCTHDEGDGAGFHVFSENYIMWAFIYASCFLFWSTCMELLNLSAIMMYGYLAFYLPNWWGQWIYLLQPVCAFSEHDCNSIFFFIICTASSV